MSVKRFWEEASDTLMAVQNIYHVQMSDDFSY